MIIIIFFLLLLLAAIGFVFYFLFRGVVKTRPQLSVATKGFEYLLIIFYIFSFVCHLIFTGQYNSHYSVQQDGIDSGYEYLSSDYSITIYTYYILFLASAVILWIKDKSLPPVVALLCHIFLLGGIYFSGKIIFQLSHNTEDAEAGYFGMVYPIANIAIAVYLMIRRIKLEIEYSQHREYKNYYLNTFNSFLAKSVNFYWMAILLAFPVYILITLILMIFGQDYHSMTKIFTDTTTWAMSQKQHPPYLEHNGHYLCTVAACGSPKLVKPVFIGKRHHHQIIIVNRQLQIANAFEEIIEKKFPHLHHLIRTNYDKYGYNLSKKINSKRGSDITYLLMKPLEIFFLVFIYTFSHKPEELIKKQYRD